MADAEVADYLLSSSPQATPQVERIDVYRRLVRGAFRSTIAHSFPDTREVLGEEKFDAMLSAFLDDGGPNTPFFREIPGDLVEWALETDYPLADLLQWEWLELVAARHPADLDTMAALPSAAGVLRTNPTIQLAVYSRPLEEITSSEPSPEPFDAPMAYLVWRRPHTDETETHKIGLLLARGLELASSALEPPSIEEVAELLAAEATGLNRATILEGLRGLELELRAREGIL